MLILTGTLKTNTIPVRQALALLLAVANLRAYPFVVCCYLFPTGGLCKDDLHSTDPIARKNCNILVTRND